MLTTLLIKSGSKCQIRIPEAGHQILKLDFAIIQRYLTHSFCQRLSLRNQSVQLGEEASCVIASGFSSDISFFTRRAWLVGTAVSVDECGDGLRSPLGIFEILDLGWDGDCHGPFTGATDMKKAVAVNPTETGKTRPGGAFEAPTHRLEKSSEMIFPNNIGLFMAGVGGVQNKDRVLDLNAGDNWLSPHLEKIGAQVTDVNLLERNAAGDWIVANVQDGLDNPRPALDVLFVTMVLSRLVSPSRVFGEIKRILKPGGRLVVTEIEKYHERELKKALGQHWMGCFPGDLRHWIAAAGFSNIIVNPVPDIYFPLGTLLPGNKRLLRFIMATGTSR